MPKVRSPAKYCDDEVRIMKMSDIQDDVRGYVEEGTRLARLRLFKEAIECFEEKMAFAHSPEGMSWYAWCVAAYERRYENAVSLALIALQKELRSPEIYMNVGRVFALCGKKELAVKSFNKGLSLDSDHKGLLGEIEELGLRRKPPVEFLSRSNPVNRYLGMVSHKVRHLF